MRHPSIENPDEKEIHIDSLDRHPARRCQREIVYQPSYDDAPVVRVCLLNSSQVDAIESKQGETQMEQYFLWLLRTKISGENKINIKMILVCVIIVFLIY